jgi:hypothetical protein
VERGNGKMNIPDKIRIGGIDYEVDTNGENLTVDELHICSGLIEYAKVKISLDKKTCYEPQIQGRTLWHEIIHGLARHFGSDFDDDEKLVDMLARGIYMILEDNIENLYDLADKKLIEGTEAKA